MFSIHLDWDALSAFNELALLFKWFEALVVLVHFYFNTYYSFYRSFIAVHSCRVSTQFLTMNSRAKRGLWI